MKEIFWMIVFVILIFLFTDSGVTLTIDGTPHSFKIGLH
jgi:hypothetical protein